MLVSQLLHTVAIGTPPSNAKLIQVYRNKQQVKFLSDVTLVREGKHTVLNS